MTDPVIAVDGGPGLVLRIVLARLHQRVGAVGLVGLILLATATGILAVAWKQHEAFALSRTNTGSVVELPDSASRLQLSVPRRSTRVRLPAATDVPLLLTRVERAAVEQGLGWPQADYRFNDASTEAPASVEIRCTLRGAYPSIRRFVTALLLDNPSLTLREFGLSRANADAANVDAKLSIIIYLASGVTPAVEAPR